MNSTATEQFEKRLHELIALVQSTEASVLSGKLIKTDQLDHETEKLCDEIRRANPATAKMLAPSMALLISALDHLAQSLTTFKEEKQKEVRHK